MSRQQDIAPKVEKLDSEQVWFRVAKKDWADPLDMSYSARKGGRWNPPGVEALYVNEDVVTARFNLRLFIGRYPYHPSELNDEVGPILVHVKFPPGEVADAHTPDGLEALGLPVTYPLFEDGTPVEHEHCQPIGAAVRDAQLRGVKYRSAQTELGEGRELAWFPDGDTEPSVAGFEEFSDWYWR